jgi:hypothetical protein
VAGVVALMLQANPKLTPADIKALLRDSALRTPAGISDSVGGWFDSGFRLGDAVSTIRG